MLNFNCIITISIRVDLYIGTAVGVNKIQQGFMDLSLCPILMATNLYIHDHDRV